MKIRTTHAMTLRLGPALCALFALPAFGGEPGSRLDLEPSAKSAKGINPSAKDIMPSEKAANEALIPPPPGHRWILGGGLRGRKLGEIDFDTRASALTIPMLYGNDSFTPPAGIGPATGFEDRVYDNGFVRPDARTSGLGRTTDYGYQDQAQVQPGELLYRAVGGERRDVIRTSRAAASGWSEDREWELSPYLKLSRLTNLGNGWSAGPVFHFDFANLDHSRSGLNTRMGREQLDVFDVTATDTYDPTELVLPNAPYTGAPNIVAPLLPAVPANRAFTETLRSTEVAVWNDSISESLEVDLWGVSLGGEVVFQAPNRFFTTVGTGIAFNIADWEAKRSDRLLQQVNGGPPSVVGSTDARESGTDLLFGLYFQAAAGYQITSQFSLEANLRYDIMKRLSDTVGNSEFDLDLNGFSLGLGGNYIFW